MEIRVTFLGPVFFLFPRVTIKTIQWVMACLGFYEVCLFLSQYLGILCRPTLSRTHGHSNLDRSHKHITLYAFCSANLQCDIQVSRWKNNIPYNSFILRLRERLILAHLRTNVKTSLYPAGCIELNHVSCSG